MMRWRDFYIVSSCVLGFLFSILVLIPGCQRSALPSVAIATYRYEGNYTVIYPPEDQDPNAVDLILLGYGDDFHEWFFSVHYLSICAGYMGGTEDPDYVHLDCSLRPGSFTFRSDDKFIIDYSSVGDLFPVVPRYDITSFNLRPSFAILVLGIAFTILSIAVVLYELFTRPQSGSLSLVSVRLASLISVCLIGAAATLILISSSLVTAIILRSGYDKELYGSWTSNFIGLSWAAVGFMYLAFLIKLCDIVVQHEKNRRLLHTGQI